jgi:hypothetical protein
MEDFVTFEIAKKLKEKGFKEECLAYYTTEYTLYNNVITLTDDKYLCVSDIDYEEFLVSHNSIKYTNGNYVDAPTISQALKWLREEKKMYIEPCILADGDTDADSKVINIYTYWSYSITHIESGDMIYFEYEHIDDKRFDSYEQAALAGIEYVLDNLI